MLVLNMLVGIGLFNLFDSFLMKCLNKGCDILFCVVWFYDGWLFFFIEVYRVNCEMVMILLFVL